MKKFLLLLIVVLVAAGYLYYQNFTGSPKYSLLQAHEAMENHDMEAFEKYVDVPAVTGSLIDQLAEQRGLIGALNPASGVLRQALRYMKPQLSQVAHKEIEKYVTTGDFKKDPNAPKKQVDISLSGLWHKVVSDSAAFKGVKYVKEEGEIALVGLEFTQPRYDTTMVLEVKMRDQGEHWQVVALTNTAELLKHTSRLQKQKLVNKLR
ncbi:MAG: DUF2939 domain-containing protein [Adhaeribacter sp.]